MCNSFFLHIEWSLNIAFVNQFYCMHHGIGFKIIEFLQTFAKFLQFYTHCLSYSLIILACFNVLKTLVQIEVVQLGEVPWTPLKVKK